MMLIESIYSDVCEDLEEQKNLLTISPDFFEASEL